MTEADSVSDGGCYRPPKVLLCTSASKHAGADIEWCENCSQKYAPPTEELHYSSEYRQKHFPANSIKAASEHKLLGGIGVADGPKKYIGSPVSDDCACNSDALRRPIAEHDASDFNIDIERPNLNADADAIGYEVIVAKTT